MMTKWLTSLVLLLAIAGSTLAGMPLHSGEQECSMSGMSGMSGGMDCCAVAHMQSDTPEVSAARLCCAVNCPQSGTTAPGGSLQRISSVVIIAPHPATIQPPPPLPASKPGYHPAQDYLPNSQPTYIRHLALLI
jgi:hypothetical protein